jgi:enamine deaminase RidA (YjgF/YER057c/UK114 family)
VTPGRAATTRNEGAIVKHINPAALSRPTGYTHVVEVTGGRTLYISGQVALDRNGTLVGGGDARAQARQVFRNIEAALADAGATLDHVVKITVFLTDPAQIPVYREERDSVFKGPLPASSLLVVSRLAHPDLLLEIEAVAVVGDVP